MNGSGSNYSNVQPSENGQLSDADQVTHLAIIHPLKTDAVHNASLLAQFRKGLIPRIWFLFDGYKAKKPEEYISRLKAILREPNAIYSAKLSKPTRMLISVSWPEPITGLPKENPESQIGLSGTK
jgi:hypothetical protein